jgi:hypothetical protein
MNTFKKSLLGLGGAAALAMGVIAMSGAASADCYSCSDPDVQTGTYVPRAPVAAPHVGIGADLAFPQVQQPYAAQSNYAQSNAGQCDSVNDLPDRYSADMQAACEASAH